MAIYTATLISIRQKPTASYDLSCDGWQGLYDHWRFASVHESRERSCGDVYAVEMCASFNEFLQLSKYCHDYGHHPRVGERDANVGKNREIIKKWGPSAAGALAKAATGW
ncbi:MAG TPA: hypothetical protein VMH27_17940 [Puia sp.]|nr:hypothetical protein [Puia sp.]